MKILAYIERINLLHKLIKQSKTGSPSELSQRLGLSNSRLHRIIEELKLQGAPIAYSRQRKTYYYEYGYDISISATFNPIDDREKTQITGGAYLTGNNNFSETIGGIRKAGKISSFIDTFINRMVG